MGKKQTILVAMIGSLAIVGTIMNVSATQVPKRHRATSRQVNRQQTFDPTRFPSTVPSPPSHATVLTPVADFQAMLNDPAKTYTIEPVRARGNEKPRTQDQEKLFREAAEALRRVRPVPDERLLFFNWLDRPDSPLVRYGWNATVWGVTPTPNGWLVSISIIPKVLRQGSSARVHNRMGEDYLWANGNIQFVKAYPLTTSQPSFGW